MDTPRRLALTWQIFGDCSDILQKLLSLFETKILALDEDESAVHLSKQALKARKDKYINDILGKVSSRVLASPPCLFALLEATPAGPLLPFLAPSAARAHLLSDAHTGARGSRAHHTGRQVPAAHQGTTPACPLRRGCAPRAVYNHAWHGCGKRADCLIT